MLLEFAGWECGVLQLSARASLFSRTGRYTDLRQRREGPREQRQLLSQQDAPRFRPSPPLVLLGVDEVVDVVEVEVVVSDGDWVVDDEVTPAISEDWNLTCTPKALKSPLLL